MDAFFILTGYEFCMHIRNLCFYVYLLLYYTRMWQFYKVYSLSIKSRWILHCWFKKGDQGFAAELRFYSGKGLKFSQLFKGQSQSSKIQENCSEDWDQQTLACLQSFTHYSLFLSSFFIRELLHCLIVLTALFCIFRGSTVYFFPRKNNFKYYTRFYVLARHCDIVRSGI